MDLTLQMVFKIVRQCLVERAFSLSRALSGYWIIWIGYWTRGSDKMMTLFRYKYWIM